MVLTVCNLAAVLLTAQPPPAPPPAAKAPVEPPKAIGGVVPTVRTLPDGRQVLEMFTPPDDLSAALANHPDVQIAEAKLKIAQAELTKVKQAVAQQVTAAKGNFEMAKARLTAAEVNQKNIRKQFATVKEEDLSQLTQWTQGLSELESAKAAAAHAEAELRAATGGGAGPTDRVGVAGQVVVNERSVEFLNPPKAAPSPVADKLRELLDKPVQLDLPADAKLAAVCDALSATLTPHGLTLRAPVLGPADEAVTAGAPLKGQRPLAQWLQVVADTFSNRTVPVTTAETSTRGGQTQRSVSYMDLGRREFFVRDYGLLFTDAQRAPAGAVPLSAFLRQPQAEPPAKPKQ